MNELPNIETIESDIKNYDIIKHDLYCEDYYTNFIAFLKNSFLYERAKTLGYTEKQFLENVNLKLIYNIVQNINVYVCTSPMIELIGIYKSNNNHAIPHSIIINDYSYYEIPINKNTITIIYLLNINNNNFRHVEIKDIENYKHLFNINRRKKKERKKKLKKIYEK